MTNENIAETYAENGYVLPLDIISSEEAKALRDDFEKAETELSGQPEKLDLLRTYTDRLLPSFDQLIRNERLIEAASAALGPNLMVWNAGLFIKEANSTKIVSWHQDLTYWGLDDAEEATCWVALSSATKNSGCMRFIPGSHKTKLAPHVDSYSEDNLLSRGQEIAVEVDENAAVTAELKPGQASMHHGRLYHASGPNQSDDRRIGLAIRYIKPSMKQESGDRTLVSLVSGEDTYGHFEVASSPGGRLTDADFELCLRDKEIKQRLLY